MIGATAKSEQFMTRSGSESTKGSRKGYSLLGGGIDPVSVLTSEEQRASLVARVKLLNELRKTPEGKRNKAMGMEIQELHRKISAIRRKMRSEDPNDIPRLFIDICKERMTKLEFNMIMSEANNRQRKARNEKK